MVIKQLNISELQKLPYFITEPTGGRMVPLIPFFDKGQFSFPFAYPDGRINILMFDRFVSGNYISKEPVNVEMDFYLPLLDLIIQRITLPKPLFIMQTIVSDVINLVAGLEKYCLIQRYPDKLAATFLVATELESLFYSVRSLYDHLQKISKDIWNKTTILDTSVKKKELPDSFRGVILTGERDDIRSIEEVKERFGLPDAIATFYYEQGEFFKLCRAIRDDMVHGGKSLSKQTIYPLNGGFAVKVTDDPYSQFACWNPDDVSNNDLGDVRTLMAYIIRHIIDATSKYGDALVSCSTSLAEPLNPAWRVFTRLPFAVHLQKLETYIQKPWQLDCNNETRAAQHPAEG